MDEVKEESHPAFGMLEISKVQGNARPLFGSAAIRHGNTIRLRVKRATRERHLNDYWYHAPTKDIVEIELSPVQWADAISSLNTSGVPCTLLYVDGKPMEVCPVDSERNLVNDEFKKDSRKVGAKFTEFKVRLDELLAKPRLNKEEKQEIKEIMAQATMFFNSNAPFIHNQFEEAMEKTVSQAKGEIEAFFSHTVINLGLQAMEAKREAGEQLLIEAPNTEGL